MNLLHVSFEPVEEFIPRIPEERHIDEDQSIPRICLSDDIRLALRAMPHAGTYIKFFLARKRNPIFYVYRLSPEKIGHIVPRKQNLRRAINYCSSKDKYAVLDELWVSDYVLDARHTHEHWLLAKPDMKDFTCVKYEISHVETERMYADDIASYYDFIHEVNFREVQNDGRNDNLSMFLNMFHFIDEAMRQELLTMVHKYGLRTMITNMQDGLKEEKVG